MGCFFFLGLAVSVVLLSAGLSDGAIGVFGTTVAISVVWGIVDLIGRGKGRRQQEETDRELHEAARLQTQFTKETDVLSAKLKVARKISPEAEEHYAQTYSQLMPLLRAHGSTLDSRVDRAFEEEGDYSKHPGVVKIFEDMYRYVTSGIAGQKISDLIVEQTELLTTIGGRSGIAQELIEKWESLYATLRQKVNTDDPASEDIKKYFEHLLVVSKGLFPLLPQPQIDEFQGRVSTLISDLRSRALALAQMPPGDVGEA